MKVKEHLPLSHYSIKEFVHIAPLYGTFRLTDCYMQGCAHSKINDEDRVQAHTRRSGSFVFFVYRSLRLQFIHLTPYLICHLT